MVEKVSALHYRVHACTYVRKLDKLRGCGGGRVEEGGSIFKIFAFTIRHRVVTIFTCFLSDLCGIWLCSCGSPVIGPQFCTGFRPTFCS